MPASAAIDFPSVPSPPGTVPPEKNLLEERVEGAALPAIPIPLHIPKLPPVQIAEDRSNEKIFWIFVAVLSFLAAGFCLFTLIPAGIALARLAQLSRRPSQLKLHEDRAAALLLQRVSLLAQLTALKLSVNTRFEQRVLSAAIKRVDWELTKCSLSLKVEIDKKIFD